MANVNIRVDDALKRDTEGILSELGLSLSAATNMFYKQVVRYGGIPLDLRVDPFYSKTNMERIRRGIAALDAGQGVEHELIEVEDQ
ncbi:MAG: type II toxin-antitoxin system RelB/DinJ family antitoxin [Oscillospiraceae bacterium]|nr:type II toxin-antitoxin system RelB/DinJ family antitoxin [Oscillospiraceae bacterium]